MSHATVAVIIKNKIPDGIKKKLREEKRNIENFSDLPLIIAEHLISLELNTDMSPFDENTEVPRYISMTRQDIINSERKRINDYIKDKKIYEDAPEDNKPCWNKGYIDLLFNKLEILKNKTDRQLYIEYVQRYDKSDISPDGGIYSTYNPKSKWDWYEIGGRWHNCMYTKEKDTDGLSIGVNICQLKDLDLHPVLKTEEGNESIDFKTYAILDDKGEWHEANSMGWWGISNATKEEKENFDKKYEELLTKEDPENWVVLVDYHI